MLMENQIEFLNQVCKNEWTQIDGYINIYGNIKIYSKKLTIIPIKIGKVYGHFHLYDNTLTTLKNTPIIVGGDFCCENNMICSLKYGPKNVTGSYSCINNLLTNLYGAPEICNSNFYCSNSKLTSLEGCPRIIKKDFYCNDNPNLNILYGIGQVNKNVYYDKYNDLNEWMIQRARENIFSTYTNIANWIKSNKKYEFLLHSSKEIRQHFSEYIIKSVELNLC